MDIRTVGVEEEFLLVDPNTGTPRAAADAVLRLPPHGGDGGLLQSEFQRQQLETGTRPCISMTELADQIRQRRRGAAAAARRHDVTIAALGTCPLPVRPIVTATERYLRMAEQYSLTADEHLTCGCHVHVAIESPDEGVAVLDRIRPWLPTLLALSANSPFWQGVDSGYASYRRQAVGRWPSSGPTELYGSAAGYRAAIDDMLRTGAILDEAMVYFDARLSHHYPTIEVRVADVCLLVDHAVLIAALVRALVETAAGAWRAGEPPQQVRVGQLQLATWRAARYGLRQDLVHPLTGCPVPAETAVRALLDHTAPVLAESGDLVAVEGLLLDVLKRGNGADQQREFHQQTGDLSQVVVQAAARTLEE